MTSGATSQEAAAGVGIRDLEPLLHSSAGLVESHCVDPPSASTVGMWRVTVRLKCAHDGEPGVPAPQPCVAGAVARTRAEALRRAVAVSVARFALHSSPGVVATASELGAGAFAGAGHDVSLSALDPTTPTTWYPARHVRSGRQVLVPAGLVDHPGPRGEVGFDPGPSGASAGLGYDAALRSALLETVERDAVIVSWARRLHLRAIDLGSLAAREDDGGRELDDLLGLAGAAGLSSVVAEVPASVRGVRCVVGGFRADSDAGPTICVGATASDDLATAVRGALAKSLLLPHLAAPRDDRARIDPPSVITGEEDRLAFFASVRGADALEHWLADPAPPRARTAGGLSCEGLLRHSMSDGLDPLVLDLTCRLPRAARDRGWSVVKVVPAGYQPLRVDERCAFGWHLGRVRNAPRRTGVPARLGTDQRRWAPHPLV